MDERDGPRDTLKGHFLLALLERGIIAHAAEKVGVGRATVYRWQEQDPTFGAAMREARIEAGERLEAEAYRRADDGVKRRFPILYQGEQVGERVERHYSDLLLIFLLKAIFPEKYRDRGEGAGVAAEQPEGLTVIVHPSCEHGSD
jgi:hypothetical protein